MSDNERDEEHDREDREHAAAIAVVHYGLLSRKTTVRMIHPAKCQSSPATHHI
jgi:hypothetical protein